MNPDSIKADIISVTWNSLYILSNANSDDGEYELPPAARQIAKDIPEATWWEWS